MCKGAIGEGVSLLVCLRNEEKEMGQSWVGGVELKAGWAFCLSHLPLRTRLVTEDGWDIMEL